MNDEAAHISVRTVPAIPALRGPITRAKRGNCVAIAMADTGTGISADHLEAIFEHVLSTKEVGKGTGWPQPGIGFAKQPRRHRGRKPARQGDDLHIYLPPAASGSLRKSLRPAASRGARAGTTVSPRGRATMDDVGQFPPEMNERIWDVYGCGRADNAGKPALAILAEEMFAADLFLDVSKTG